MHKWNACKLNVVSLLHQLVAILLSNFNDKRANITKKTTNCLHDESDGNTMCAVGRERDCVYVHNVRNGSFIQHPELLFLQRENSQKHYRLPKGIRVQPFPQWKPGINLGCLNADIVLWLHNDLHKYAQKTWSYHTLTTITYRFMFKRDILLLWLLHRPKAVSPWMDPMQMVSSCNWNLPTHVPLNQVSTTCLTSTPHRLHVSQKLPASFFTLCLYCFQFHCLNISFNPFPCQDLSPPLCLLLISQNFLLISNFQKYFLFGKKQTQVKVSYEK